MSILPPRVPAQEAPQHDPETCGLDLLSSCPTCRKAFVLGGTSDTWDDWLDRTRDRFELSRRPRVLQQEEWDEAFHFLADVAATVRRRSVFAMRLRQLVDQVFFGPLSHAEFERILRSLLLRDEHRELMRQVLLELLAPDIGRLVAQLTGRRSA